MEPKRQSMIESAGRVAVIYGAIAAIWIFFSDHLLALVLHDAESLTVGQTTKGIAFVAVTAVLLFLLVHREMSKYAELRERTRDEEERLAAQILDSEQALHASERKFRVIFESAPVGIFTLRSDQSIGIVNATLADLLGYGAADLEGRSPRELSPAEDYEEQYRLDSQLVSGQRDSYALERTYRRKDGEIIWANLVVASIRGKDGKPLFAVGIIQDITERKEREKEIRQLNEELEHKVESRTRQLQLTNKELEAFSYSVSHDLRAPLDSIEGFGQAIREDYGQRLNGTGSDYLNRILQSTGHMRRLIDDLLSLSRTSSQVLEPAETDLSSIAREIIHELHHRHSGRNVQCLVESGLLVRADAGLMRVLLENLIGNAWKFTARTENPRIEFGRCKSPPKGLEVQEEEQVYFVSDNGVGFDMGHADRLFTPFQRLHRESDFPGTGVGLATAERVVIRHGGRIWAESSTDRGATFYFTLP